jgi:prepilin-type N-terminal cleavage/methylation domain-containing protein
MNRSTSHEQGFSAIEMLIALFIAAAFIFTGYQLYSVVIKDGSAARLRSRASNVAYENLQKYAPNVTSPCSVASPVNPTAPSDLPSATVSVTFSCPYGTSSATSRIQAVVSYGTLAPKQTVTEALYVTAQP